jgi:glycerate dehydrogenase
MLDTSTLGGDVDLSPVRLMGDVTEYGITEPEDIAPRIRDAEVVIVNKIKLHKGNLSEASKLKLICVTATGYDNINLEDCRSLGVALCNVPAYSTESVAQLTLAMALSLANRLEDYRSYVHGGAYSLSGVANRLTPSYHELSSLTWGVMGGGAIGSRVAMLAEAFGCRVLMCRQSPDDRYEQVSVDELCRRSDILSLHVPLTEKTRGIISRDRIASMKSGAILINVARGAVTDEEALTEAIESGHLGGLGVDVYSREPFPTEHPFTRILDRQNVCLTPHMAWGAVEARNRCLSVIAENIESFYSGNTKNRIV